MQRESEPACVRHHMMPIEDGKSCHVRGRKGKNIKYVRRRARVHTVCVV